MKHVDALSRCLQTVTTEKGLAKDVIHREQKNDPFCETFSVKPAGARAKLFYDQDGEIYKRQRLGEPLLVVPKILEKDVVALNRYHIRG
jgi:hypothetical protein